MNKIGIVAVLAIFIALMAWFIMSRQSEVLMENNNPTAQAAGEYSIAPVEHASFKLLLGGMIILNDPVGEASMYQLNGASPDLILVTDIHGDHLSVETLTAVSGTSTILIAPQVVFDELPDELQTQTVVMGNGDSHTVADINIEALPAYNLPQSADAYHVKGRGNGYLLEQAGTRIYIAGDTADIPEMRALEDIDVAFLPMNMPYTMPVDVAADAVLDFEPRFVYPYHYRGTDGFADISEFSRIVEVGNPDIQVIELDWYID